MSIHIGNHFQICDSLMAVG